MGALATNSQRFLFAQRSISGFRCLVAPAFVAISTIVAERCVPTSRPIRGDDLSRGGGSVCSKGHRLDNAMNERLAILMKARERMIEERDPFAKVLAGPLDRDRSERARTRFVELQNLIEAIERAIKCEQQSAEAVATQPTPR
jgi:hypothetical protein